MTALGSSCLVRLAVSSWLAGGSVEGHQLVWALCLAPAWFLAVLVTRLERHWALPSVPTHGHGLPLLLFWAAGVVHEALAFLGLHSPHWWFGAHSCVPTSLGSDVTTLARDRAQLVFQEPYAACKHLP